MLESDILGLTIKKMRPFFIAILIIFTNVYALLFHIAEVILHLFKIWSRLVFHLVPPSEGWLVHQFIRSLRLDVVPNIMLVLSLVATDDGLKIIIWILLSFPFTRNCLLCLTMLAWWKMTEDALNLGTVTRQVSDLCHIHNLRMQTMLQIIKSAIQTLKLLGVGTWIQVFIVDSLSFLRFICPRLRWIYFYYLKWWC